MIPVVQLQAQKGFLDQVLGVIDTAATAAQQAAELLEEGAHLVHDSNVSRAG